MSSIKLEVMKQTRNGDSYSIVIKASSGEKSTEYSFKFIEPAMTELRSQSQVLYYKAVAYNQFQKEQIC
jgi:hypothetical protein